MNAKLKSPGYKMEQYLREKTIRAVIDTIEHMAFMEVIPSNLMSPYDETTDRVRAEILINAPFPGELRLILSRTLAKHLTINTCQTERVKIKEGRCVLEDINRINIPDDLLEDALGEIINIVTGKLMTDLMPNDQGYEIGLPEIGADAFLGFSGASLCVEFFAEGHPFWLILFGDGFLNSRLIKANQ